MLEPNKVFTPGRLPLKPTNVYATRRTAEAELSKAYKRSLVPIVYGEYGVGKTSMVRKFFLDAERKINL
jgi:tRNA A37 threonylcarbamoyladenosine biosynthesis protein TsaE